MFRDCTLDQSRIGRAFELWGAVGAVLEVRKGCQNTILFHRIGGNRFLKEVFAVLVLGIVQTPDRPEGNRATGNHVLALCGR